MSENKDVDAHFEDDPGSLDGVIDEDDAEDLKLDDVNTKVWLVKVPKFLAEKWRSVDEKIQVAMVTENKGYCMVTHTGSRALFVVE